MCVRAAASLWASRFVSRESRRVVSRHVTSALRCAALRFCVCVHLNAALPISDFSQIWRTGNTREMQRARSEAIKGGAEGTTRAISCSLQNHSILHFASFTPFRLIFTHTTCLARSPRRRRRSTALSVRTVHFTSLHFALDAHSFALEERAHLCSLSVQL